MNTVEVKICGLTNKDDAEVALDSGADYLGFILYTHSPRGITTAKLIEILGKINRPVKAIGVFVNMHRTEVEQIARDCNLHAVQLHGNEKPRDFVALPFPIWRAVRFTNGHPRPYPRLWAVERYLVDAAVVGKYGGTGALSDWQKASQLAKKHSVMLAGGLTPENVAKAISAVKPLGVDVVTGVESAPGKKDHKKLKAFIKAARE
jgi:phosphoribosylanthranilate isomerase